MIWFRSWSRSLARSGSTDRSAIVHDHKVRQGHTSYNSTTRLASLPAIPIFPVRMFHLNVRTQYLAQSHRITAQACSLRQFVTTSNRLQAYKMDAVAADPSLPTSAAQDAGQFDHKGDKKIQVAGHNQYKTPRLRSSEVDSNPMVQFQNWLASALNPKDGQPEVHEPEAMTICTSSPHGTPSARVVLLKQADSTGFVFYTNYSSRKSRELAANPYASIAIYWRELSRSVRVVGKAEKVSREESVEYFESRPRGSQIGAWASRQSEVLEDEDVLEDRVKMIEKKFEGVKVDCPDFWGGWRIVPL